MVRCYLHAMSFRRPSLKAPLDTFACKQIIVFNQKTRTWRDFWTNGPSYRNLASEGHFVHVLIFAFDIAEIYFTAIDNQALQSHCIRFLSAHRIEQPLGKEIGFVPAVFNC